jgi:SAM-dependent methyltransferase
LAADLSQRDSVELKRSAIEASRTALAQVEIERYLNPPPDTPYALEYAFYLLGDIRGKIVVDLGCGSGENLLPLARRGARVVGIDISPELIVLAERRLKDYDVVDGSVTVQVGSAYQTGLPDEYADVVFSMALLHHLDLPSARREIRRVLGPAGRFIFSEPIRFSRIVDKLRRLFPGPKADISEFEHPMTREEIAIICEGFSKIAERNFRLPFVPVFARVHSLRRKIWAADRLLLQKFPWLEHFATGKVVCLQK